MQIRERWIAPVFVISSIAAACGPGGYDQVCDVPGACSSEDAGSSDTASDAIADTSAATVDAAVEGAARPAGDGGGGGSTTCVAGTDPKDDIPRCVTDEAGVFVNASGDDIDGSKAHPYKTIGNALQNLKGKTRVFVCLGAYSENVAVTSTVSLYGGFTCDFRSYSSTRSRVAPATGVALDIAASSVTIEDMEFDGPDYQAGVAGESSIAAVVHGAQAVVFTRVTLKAQGAGAGRDASPIASFSGPSSPGNVPVGVNGGLAQPVTCTNGTGSTLGGAGGDGGGSLFPGSAGTPPYAMPRPTSASNGAGGTSATCASGGTGHDGSTGLDGSNGPGSTSLGVLNGTTWTPRQGSGGTAAKVGQGGGGGTGQTTGPSAGGGAGGCGGVGGGGGNGGGASIALISVGSFVALHASAVSPASGGRGGAGADGQSGQLGGARANAGGGCPSGMGGNGGVGGGGGGGAGGVSFGILANGTPPTMLDGTLIFKGAGGVGGIGKPNAGIAGKAIDVQDATLL